MVDEHLERRKYLITTKERIKMLPELIKLLGTLGGAGVSAWGASQTAEDEEALKKKEMEENARQFDISTAIGKGQTDRGQNLEGLKMLTDRVAQAQGMASRRTLRNKIFNALAGV